MAIAFDAQLGNAHADTGSTTTQPFTTANPVAAGGFIILLVSWFHATATASITTTGGLTWTQDKFVATSNDNLAIFSAQAPAGLASGTSLVATFTASSNGRAIAGFSFTGVATSSPAENSTSATSAAGTAWTSAALTPVAVGSVMVGMGLADGLTGSSTPAATFTEVPTTAGDFNDATATETWTSIYKLSVSGSTTAAGAWSGSAARGEGLSVIYKADVGVAVAPGLVMPTFQGAY